MSSSKWEGVERRSAKTLPTGRTREVVDTDTIEKKTALKQLKYSACMLLYISYKPIGLKNPISKFVTRRVLVLLKRR